MASVIIDVPAELPSALGVLPADVGREIQLMAALKLFECGRISGGMAAELAGMPRADFLVRRFSRPPIFSSSVAGTGFPPGRLAAAAGQFEAMASMATPARQFTTHSLFSIFPITAKQETPSGRRVNVISAQSALAFPSAVASGSARQRRSTRCGVLKT